ncbi:MAG: sel1 repeat family protein [Gammaproteobacteria bacterium]|nr:sel1 repeat family protein [Gammaproteobacteria bacterium]MCP5201169.1 sel1 repeat family protein [Gammaproteobacteria bacterium]
MRKITALLLLSLLATPAAADFNDGVVALMMGKFDEALQTFVPLAESQDHAYAQYFLGRMYAAGQGVEQDDAKAAEWYRKAAEKGVGDAQYRLGDMYENGVGVPADMEYAYGWYSVAAHLGNAKGAKSFDRARDKLSAAELVEAEKLSREFIEKYGAVPQSTARQQ